MGITLISMTQGNPVALARTVNNITAKFKGLVDEVIIGDLIIFDEDRDAISEYLYNSKASPECLTKLHRMDFNAIYHRGFADVLNELADLAKNDLVLYMNVSEIVDGEINFNALNMDGYNCYMFDHSTEQHKWIRLYDHKKLRWSGPIHEEVTGEMRVCPELAFRMADTEKDSGNEFKTWVNNTTKELVYFNQYLTIVDRPDLRGSTNIGWVKYAQDSYQYIKDRMLIKGDCYETFKNGDLEGYRNACKLGFKVTEEYKTNKLINFSKYTGIDE